MIGMHVTVKRSFFDSDKVQGMIDKKTAKAFVRAGSFIRRTARQSMKKRKKGVAKPGSPPFAHGNPLLKDKLFFAYDDKTKSVVIGPVGLNGRSTKGVPKLMERGGIVEKQTKKKGLVARHYAPHPYMKPALEINRPKIVNQFGKIS